MHILFAPNIKYSTKDKEDSPMKQQTTALCEVKKQNKVQTLLSKIGKRNIIIASSVLLIATAVLLNWILFSNANKDGYDGYDQPSGNISGDLNNSTGDTAAGSNSANTYFSATQINRQKARDEALEVLQAVVENVDADEETKKVLLKKIDEAE